MSSVFPSPVGPATTAKRGTMSAADKAKLDAVTGTNTGDVALGAVGTTPAAEGASLAGQVLTLQPADATHPGVLTTGAQTIGGVKTLTAAVLAGITSITEAVTSLVRAVGVSLVLRSSLGAGASDKCVVVGSSEVDGTVNASAQIWTAATGIGGTQVDVAWFRKDGALRNASGYVARGKSATSGFLYVGDDVGTRMVYGSQTITCGTGIALNSTGTYLNVYVGSAISKSYAADGATAAAFDVDTNTAWSNAAATLQRWRNAGTTKSSIMSNGEFEHAVAGAGIVLKSPDGTRYRLTVANGGTLVIAGA
ncbi:MAG: hypothetical protein ACYC1Z_13225 [Georgenia sp.]